MFCPAWWVLLSSVHLIKVRATTFMRDPLGTILKTLIKGIMEKLIGNKFKPVLIFLLINFSVSSIFYFFIIFSGSIGNADGNYIIGMMWSPGISTIITMKILKRNISDLGWKWGELKYQLRSYLIPLAYISIAYLIIWNFGFGKFYNQNTFDYMAGTLGLGGIGNNFAVLIYVLLTALFGIILSMATALGEEIGWRGFLVPELYKHLGFTKTSLIVGFIWGAWHLPILIFSDYNIGATSWYAATCFMTLVISISFIYTWFRIKSGSVWTSVILHASHNLFLQQIFTPLTEDNGNTEYFIDEFGIILPITTLAFAVYYWNKRHELKHVPNMG